MTILDKLRAAASSDVDDTAQWVCTFGDVRALAAEADRLRNACTEHGRQSTGDGLTIARLKAEVEWLRGVVDHWEAAYHRLRDENVDLSLRTTTPRVTEAMREFVEALSDEPDDHEIDSTAIVGDRGVATKWICLTLGDLRALATAQPVETVAEETRALLAVVDDGDDTLSPLGVMAYRERWRSVGRPNLQPFTSAPEPSHVKGGLHETTQRVLLDLAMWLAEPVGDQKHRRHNDLVFSAHAWVESGRPDLPTPAKDEPADEEHEKAIAEWRERYDFLRDDTLDAIEDRAAITEQLIARGRR